MYAQVTKLRVPVEKMAELRAVIEQDYLPVVQLRPGFIAAYFLEQIDDPTEAELVSLWESHASVEIFNRTGLLVSSVQVIAATVPGVQVQRQGYLVRLALTGTPAAHSGS